MDGRCLVIYLLRFDLARVGSITTSTTTSFEIAGPVQSKFFYWLSIVDVISQDPPMSYFAYLDKSEE